jgi:hypothetical protein
MSDIIEILGEKKFAGSRNKELSTRIVFEEDKKIRYETNLFYDISQQTQYIEEKRQSNNFRIYGKINPVLNFNVNQRLTNNTDVKVDIDSNLFDLNLFNWTIVLLKSKRIESKVDPNGKQTYIKGVKKLEKRNGNDVVIDLDFKRGLPGRIYNSTLNSNNLAIFLPLGHNFQIGDKIKIDSIDTDLLDSKVYDVVDIKPNIIYINAKPIKTIYREETVQNTKVFSKNVDDFTNAAKTTAQFNEQKTNQKINNLIFKQIEVATIINTPRPKIQSLIRPDFYISKVVEKELLEYYVKSLEVVAIIDELDPCAFSVNNYGQQIYNFTLNRDLNIDNLFNNINEPISDLYIGIIKNGQPIANSFSDVESHFSRYIENVGNGYGIETIVNNKILNSKPKLGDVFLHSLCEYTTENLTETEITHISHRFIYKNVLFHYNPFTKIQLKLRSPYIEDDENVQVAPSHSVYSRQREKYIWRDIFNVGFFDENGNSIDFPFMNGSFYVFKEVNFFLIPESENVRKYNLNANDVTGVGNIFSNQFGDAFKNVDINEIEPTDIKPFNQYTDQKC